jgi:glycosyltransferase involved in cell wall biosynthesis
MMTKIVLIGPVYPYRGGIAHFTSNLAQTFNENGYDLTVISFSKQYPKWLYPGKDDKDLSDGRRVENVEYIFSPLNPFDWFKTVKRIKDLKPDLVILQWWTTFWSFADHSLLSNLKKAGIPTKVIVHNAIPHEDKKIDQLLARYALGNAVRFVVMNKREEKKIKDLVRGALIQFVPFPIYRPFDTKVISKSEARNILGLNEDKKIGLFFGFIRSYKGLGVLLDAIKILNDEGQLNDFCFLIAGEFWHDKKQYMDKIKAFGIEDHVVVHDHYIPDNQAGSYFQAADFFVAPYTAGTQSGALKMAMGYGLPCIVSSVIADDISRLPSSGNIIIFSDSNAPDLAEKIKTISQSSDTLLGHSNVNELKTWNDLVAGLMVLDEVGN